MKTFWWAIFIFFSITIGFYPAAYLLFDMKYGLLASKSAELLQNTIWYTAFYQHIFLGAIAMLTGWSQFSKRFRNKNLNAHRNLGKVYLIAVALSGSAGLFIAFYATGGLISFIFCAYIPKLRVKIASKRIVFFIFDRTPFVRFILHDSRGKLFI